jgi:hypothetical protein
MDVKCFHNENYKAKSKSELFHIAEWDTMSGEIGWLVYADAEGNMFKKTDWVMDKPESVCMSDVCKACGCSEIEVESMWNNFYSEVK